MDLVDTHKGGDFTLYFLGCLSTLIDTPDRADKHQGDIPRGDREALLELTHNHGTESDESFSYCSGNEVRRVVSDDADTTRPSIKASDTSASPWTTSRRPAIVSSVSESSSRRSCLTARWCVGGVLLSLTALQKQIGALDTSR